MYKRILLKLSGEQLQGKFDGGFDVERAVWIANELKKVKGANVIIMVGGGNYARGAQLASGGINRVTADNIGMLATVMNAVALADIFNAEGLEARALSNIVVDQVADAFTHRRALSHLAKNRTVIVAGGIGRPYLTTDTAAVNLALELNCDVILKATKVDGVYTDDPMANPTATKYDTLSLKQAVEEATVRVMDKSAIALAYEFSLPLVVFKLLAEDAISRVVRGEKIGTLVS